MYELFNIFINVIKLCKIVEKYCNTRRLAKYKDRFLDFDLFYCASDFLR